jgi:hypothetical protein
MHLFTLFAGLSMPLLTRVAKLSMALPTCAAKLSMPLLARLAMLLNLMLASFFSPLRSQSVAVSNWMSLFKVCMFHVSQVFHAFTPYSVVDKSTVLISAKVISDNAPAIEAM